MSMANRVFSTIEGRCKLNQKGNRQSVYAVIGATGNSDVLAEVFYYDSADRRFYSSPQRKTWIRNSTATPHRPFCGYRGDEGPCGTGTSAALILLGIVLAAFVLVTTPFAAVMVVSRQAIET
ncbi:hypothetical protein RvY_16690-3 [Ramazzottius varieornatus]|uniref:Uncharacterized protein n=1 Tax=Ramazzottius varieornatus TaxID=947166 RepID=A0A1D1W0J8_RAMVA|nr:hypothetical protein RvY_16690-3 [Ramazzottius varieornatus]